MKKRNPKKLALRRDTEDANRVGKTWSDPPQCDPACGSQTVSCTL